MVTYVRFFRFSSECAHRDGDGGGLETRKNRKVQNVGASRDGSENFAGEYLEFWSVGKSFLTVRRSSPLQETSVMSSSTKTDEQFILSTTKSTSSPSWFRSVDRTDNCKFYACLAFSCTILRDFFVDFPHSNWLFRRNGIYNTTECQTRFHNRLIKHYRYVYGGSVVPTLCK